MCNYCGRSFTSGTNCRSHKRKCHPLELAELEGEANPREELHDEATNGARLDHISMQN